jgi:energy-coupling factor transporter transmembrane protein EcfT
MGPTGLGVFSILFAGIALLLERWKWAPFRALRGWSLLLLLLFAVQAFSLEPSNRLLPWLPATRQSLELAALSCWRLGLLIAYANLFTLITSPRRLEAALTQMLRWLPFVPARRIGMMVSLTLRFLPLLLLQAQEVGQAFRSRLGGRRKNPVDRLRLHALPILRKALVRADELSWALASRGYRDDLPIEAEPVPRRHLVLALAWIGITVMAVWMS